VAQRIFKDAEYVIIQADPVTNASITTVFRDKNTPEADIIAEAQNLDQTNPGLRTVWFLRGITTEEVFLPGTVNVQAVAGGLSVNIVGADAETATINGNPLSLVFYLDSANPGDVIQFFNEQNELIAETTL